MIEEKLQKKLRKSITAAICIIVGILACGALISAYLQNAKTQVVRNQVIAEAEEYKDRILKQLDGDSQILTGISQFIDSNHAADHDALAERLSQVLQSSSFVTIVYYDQSETGIICNRGKEAVLDAPLSALSKEAQEVILQSLQGTASVSKLFESSISGRRVFVYSVPVYDGEQLIGALAASDHIEIFSDILSGNTVLGGGGYIHMLDSQGNFLIRSSRSVVPQALPSIFDGPYLSADSKEETRKALADQKRIFSTFTYENRTYPFLLEPVGFNNWYLFCVNTGEGLIGDSSASILTMQITFAAILFLVLLLTLRGYRLLRDYNRQLRALAYHDALTGAESLSRFRQRLPEALAHTGGSVSALCVRQFPFIIEIFGKEKANQLLCQIKETAELHLRSDEFFCRDTDDRFYFFLRDTDRDAIQSRLLALTDALEHSAEIGRTNYQLAFYTGVAISQKSVVPQEAADNLMTHVQFALDRAKGGYASTIWFFDAELHIREELENYIESHMKQALQDGEFKLFLQPKKDLKTDRLSGAEALVRWITAEGKSIFPDQFIPLFEQNGFCVKLDLYMVEQSCKQLRSWIDDGFDPLPLSVNQSKLLFFEPDYVNQITELVKQYRIPASLITLEILEGLALENVDELNAKIVQLQSEGFRVSLDDFGSGFSSMNILGKLEIDELKLDRDFLLSASGPDHSRVRLILEEIVKIAQKLHISTVAEGVETVEDEAMIRNLGCDYGQGYLYSRPVNAEEFSKKYIKNPENRKL